MTAYELGSGTYYGSRERHSCSRSHVRVQLRVHDHVHTCCVVVRLFLVARARQGLAVTRKFIAETWKSTNIKNNAVKPKKYEGTPVWATPPHSKAPCTRESKLRDERQACFAIAHSASSTETSRCLPLPCLIIRQYLCHDCNLQRLQSVN